jgi:hypothetical protein
VDLLLEIEQLREMLGEHINTQNWKRVTSYLLACALYLPPDDAESVRTLMIRFFEFFFVAI